MKKLWQNCKGMVTVMVTLLLIPSLLVTGSAVDIARIYAAKSVLQDANQLAANSTLTSYDALLQDLYGLYAIMQSDAQLAEMINEYIEVSVLGQDGQGKGMGTFQLLYGSELQPGTITPADKQNLGNTDVLRRQIEEYAKFRVPVVLVDEILDRLDSFKKIQKDAEIIEDKMDLDDELEDLTDAYEKVYDKIVEIHSNYSELIRGYEEINNIFDKIHDQLITLEDVRRQYTEYAENHKDTDSGTAEEKAHWEEVKKDYKTRYSDLQGNVRALVRGGQVKSNWVQGKWEDEEKGIWAAGYYQSSAAVSKSLNSVFDNAVKACKKAQTGLDDLVKLARKADDKRDDLAKKLNELETKINQPDSCSDALKESLTKPSSENGGKSALDVYRSLLNYKVETMAQGMQGQDAPVLQKALEFLEDPLYGDWKDPSGGAVVQLTVLENIKSANGFEIDLVIYNKEHPDAKKADRLSTIRYIGPSLYHYDYPQGFKYFQEISGSNAEFYKLLQDMFGSETTKAKKSTAKKAATKIFAEAQKKFKEALDNYEPEGAWVYTPYGGGSGDTPEEERFGQDGDWSKENKGKDATKNALKGDLVQRLGKLAADAADHLLLLGYDSEMFSCYTTNKGSEKGRTSMAGIPLGIDVNYFYQSELEFLYGGSYDAKENLKSVAGMIFLVRFVFNYIASFSVDSVNTVVNNVKSALSGIAGPFAFIIGELVRVGMALGESAMDVGRIRNGHMVKLFKDSHTWRFSISGLVNSAKDGLSESVSFGEENNSGDDDTGPDVFGYRDYLRVFLLLKSDTELAQRTKKLIELNLTNKRNGIGGKGDHTAREQAMSGIPLEDLSKGITGFTITTEVNLRMLFLSMPVAQRGVNGVVPPGFVPISVTDYRGY